MRCHIKEHSARHKNANHIKLFINTNLLVFVIINRRSDFLSNTNVARLFFYHKCQNLDAIMAVEHKNWLTDEVIPNFKVQISENPLKNVTLVADSSDVVDSLK
jgi:hypothetical protein